MSAAFQSENFNSANGIWWSDARVGCAANSGAYAFGGAECGYNVNTATGEMAHRFFDELGNKSLFDTSGNVQAGYGLVNVGPFINMQDQYYYWTGTTVAPFVSSFFGTVTQDYYAYGFAFRSGEQIFHDKAICCALYAMAVHPGQAFPIPEPESYSMVLAGLGLLGFAACRRKLRIA